MVNLSLLPRFVRRAAAEFLYDSSHDVARACVDEMSGVPAGTPEAIDIRQRHDEAWGAMHYAARVRAELDAEDERDATRAQRIRIFGA